MSAHYSKQLPPLTVIVRARSEHGAPGEDTFQALNERAISLQGLIFIVLAGLVSGISLLAKGWPESRSAHAMAASGDHAQLIALATLIVVLGVPHGALDTVFAQRSYGLRTVAAWGLFALVYLLAVGAVVLLWQLTPLLFLSGFLLISAAHFSGDPVAATPILARIFYGGAIIVLPALMHLNEVTRLFSFLSGPESAALGTALHALAWPWLVCLVIAALMCLRTDRRTAVEIAVLGFLATLLVPCATLANGPQ